MSRLTYFADSEQLGLNSYLSAGLVPTACLNLYNNEKSVRMCFTIFSQSVTLTQYVVLSIRLPACLFQLAYCLNDQAHIA